MPRAQLHSCLAIASDTCHVEWMRATRRMNSIDECHPSQALNVHHPGYALGILQLGEVTSHPDILPPARSNAKGNTSHGVGPHRAQRGSPGDRDGGDQPGQGEAVRVEDCDGPVPSAGRCRGPHGAPRVSVLRADGARRHQGISCADDALKTEEHALNRLGEDGGLPQVQVDAPGLRVVFAVGAGLIF